MSNDVFLRTKALIVAIIIETGIRPAIGEGMSKIKGMDGKYLKDEQVSTLRWKPLVLELLNLASLKS